MMVAASPASIRSAAVSDGALRWDAFEITSQNGAHTEYRPLGRTDEAESARIIDHVLARGVNFIDTADGYAGNESERIAGRALARDGKRDEIILATKGFMPQGEGRDACGASRRHIINACDASLKRLQTDWIDSTKSIGRAAQSRSTRPPPSGSKHYTRCGKTRG